VVLADCVPEVPFTVSVYWPTGVVLLAFTVKMLVPLVGFGLNDAVAPLGRPETVMFTLPVKPYSDVT